MPSIISTKTSGGGGIAVTGDTSGVMQLASADGTTAITIDASQNVGIGTSNPASKLNISGTNTGNGCHIRLQNTTSSTGRTWQLASVDSGQLFFSIPTVLDAIVIDSSGNVLVGTTSDSQTSGNGVKIKPNTYGTGLPSVEVVTAGTTTSAGYTLFSSGAGAYRFYVQDSGTIHATSTSITGISDSTLKENIRDLETGLTEVMALRPRRFDWKEETKLEEKNIAGFIAQEVETVLPDLVYDYKYSMNESKKSLKMGDMIPTLVKSIQEQQAIITDLKARIEVLEGASA
jgi:hypothetical protein